MGFLSAMLKFVEHLMQAVICVRIILLKYLFDQRSLFLGALLALELYGILADL